MRAGGGRGPSDGCCFPPQESSPALLSSRFPTLPPKASTSPGQPPTATSTPLPLKLLILTGCWSPWSSTSQATQGLLISQGFLPALISLSTSPGSLAGSAHRQSVLQLPQVHKAYLSANSAFLNSSLQVVPPSLPSASPQPTLFPTFCLLRKTGRGHCELWMFGFEPPSHPAQSGNPIVLGFHFIHMSLDIMGQPLRQKRSKGNIPRIKWEMIPYVHLSTCVCICPTAQREHSFSQISWFLDTDLPKRCQAHFSLCQHNPAWHIHCLNLASIIQVVLGERLKTPIELMSEKGIGRHWVVDMLNISRFYSWQLSQKRQGSQMFRMRVGSEDWTTETEHCYCRQIEARVMIVKHLHQILPL